MLIRVKKVLALGLILLALPSASSAHEGHDDGAKKPAVAADSGMIARTARVGDYEVMMKHPELEPFVVIPTSLLRVWAGDDPENPQWTVALKFADEAEARKVLGLSS